MRIIVPFDLQQPKTRLSSILGRSEREAFAKAMCHDVVDAILDAGHTPELLVTAAYDTDVSVTVDERPLSRAVNTALSSAELPVAIVMADLPLVTPLALDRMVSDEANVVIAPGLGGGTNALVVRHPDFTVDYHGGSYRKHRRIASERCGEVTTVDSFRLAVDVDAPADLVEVLLHSEGRAAQWLQDAGFELDETMERTTVSRESLDG